jgi:hypothetical protein
METQGAYQLNVRSYAAGLYNVAPSGTRRTYGGEGAENRELVSHWYHFRAIRTGTRRGSESHDTLAVRRSDSPPTADETISSRMSTFFTVPLPCTAGGRMAPALAATTPTSDFDLASRWEVGRRTWTVRAVSPYRGKRYPTGMSESQRRLGESWVGKGAGAD